MQIESGVLYYGQYKKWVFLVSNLSLARYNSILDTIRANVCVFCGQSPMMSSRHANSSQLSVQKVAVAVERTYGGVWGLGESHGASGTLVLDGSERYPVFPHGWNTSKQSLWASCPPVLIHSTYSLPTVKRKREKGKGKCQANILVCSSPEMSLQMNLL